MTNFDFLTKEPKFAAFSDVAINAEKILNIDCGMAVLNCRRAMEFAVKWIYSVDESLDKPYDESLVSLMSNEDFRDLIDSDLYQRMTFIRKIGNDAAHGTGKISYGAAVHAIENLYIFMDFVACCYSEKYNEVITPFDRSLLTQKHENVNIEEKEIELKKLLAENKKLREELTARREEQKEKYVPKPLELTEYETRKYYIDTQLADAGWKEGINWRNEVQLPGMPNKSELGFADYVLYDDTLKPLAVIEAKRTCKDVAIGRQQAKLYADLLEKEYGRRPVIFLTNGFDTRIVDGQYPERKVAAIYSKRDLEKLFNLRKMRTSLKHVNVNKSIAGRYYQEGAIKAVCETLDEKNRRKALLVMATGSGKTRTVMGLCDVLLNHGWVKNILFLADRTSLVTQAKRAFVNLLPNLSVTNLCEEKDNFAAHMVFSTYQTMYNCIDSVHDEEGKLFTTGHFDLVICDEAHRSIYNKYKEIFDYFDAPLVGLTATPKDEIDKNTYEIFELENGVPTYGYELSQAVKDDYLVDYMTIETTLKFMDEGITYDELSDEDKEEYESTFGTDGELPEKINASALNEWIFNEDTIKIVLNTLMADGIKVNYGETLGKTIIFAKSHYHAEKIFEVFNKEYPHLQGYAKVIDNYTNYAQSAIDEFSEGDKLPRIAISVDMLDTGIDVPEVLNLVFFKKVMSKSKFWQMIGRGTRLCPGLIDGKDKEKFYIFDFCNNFNFFRMNKGVSTKTQLALQGAIFNLKAQLVYLLQDVQYQTDELISFRDMLIDELIAKVKELNRDNFAVRQHLKCVDQYANKDNYQALTYEDTLNMREELAPIINPDNDDASAIRFDALMFGIELAYLSGKHYTRARNDLINKVAALSEVASIPAVGSKSDLMKLILNTDYLENAGINEFEHIRNELRSLMKYIPVSQKYTYTTHFTDEILSVEWKESELDNDDLKNYKAKAEFYIRQNQDKGVIEKLKTNKPLNETDVRELERILWNEVGTKDDYVAECGEKPLGVFVREIIGLDMNTAKEAFADYLNEAKFDSRQIYFVNQIVEYIVHNGMLTDFRVLQSTPFTDRGKISEIFVDASVWMNIKKVIDEINSNAVA